MYMRGSCRLCKTPIMSTSEPEAALRRLLVEGLLGVKRSGVSQAQIARRLGVSESNVSRWISYKLTPSYSQSMELCQAWPSQFDHGTLADLYAAASMGGSSGLRTVGARVIESTEDVYGALIAALDDDPKDAGSRTILHSSLHLDRRDGSDPAETDDFVDPIVSARTRVFVDRLRSRARSGWKIRQVVCASTLGRVQLLRHRLAAVDGPDVRVRAYAASVPSVINPLVVSDRHVFLGVDHPRWERPASAVHMTHPAIAAWAKNYFYDLYEAAPFELRGPNGLNEVSFRGMEDLLDLQ